MQTHPVYVAAASGPVSSQVQVGQVDYPPPPEGFELGRNATLTWLTPDARILAALSNGTTALTGGMGTQVQHEGRTVEACRFDQKIGKANLVVRANDKPSLQAALDWLSGLNKAQEAVRLKHWAAERDAGKASQRAEVPAGHIYLELVGSKADGEIQQYRLDSGEILDNPVTVGGPGPWRYATPADVEAARSKMATRHQDDAAAQSTQLAKLKAIAVPSHALSAYNRFGGDRERAWEAGAEMESVMIERYGAAIQAQGLGAAAALPPGRAELLPRGA